MVKDSGAPQGAHRIKPVNVPTPVTVECDSRNAPVAVDDRPVAGIQSVWRIDDEWWRDRSISRMYYSLCLEGGPMVTVFQDLEEKTWWEQRY